MGSKSMVSRVSRSCSIGMARAKEERIARGARMTVNFIVFIDFWVRISNRVL